MRWNFSGIFLRLLCSTKESGVSFKISSVSFLVSAPCTPSLSRNRINLQLYRLHWLYLYGPVAKDRALPFIVLFVGVRLPFPLCELVDVQGHVYTLVVIARRNGILVGVVRYFAQYTSRFPCFFVGFV